MANYNGRTGKVRFDVTTDKVVFTDDDGGMETVVAFGAVGAFTAEDAAALYGGPAPVEPQAAAKKSSGPAHNPKR